MSNDPNEPAFPRDHRHDGHNGITIRDYFAAKATIDESDLDGGSGEVILGRPCPPYDDALAWATWWADYRAAVRYINADAMLRARGQQP